MSKPRPILGEMPWNVKKMIVESADTLTRISLHPTTKSLKHAVDNSVIQYHEIILKSIEYLRTVSLKVNIAPREMASPTDRLEFYTNAAEITFFVSGTLENQLKNADLIELLARNFTKVFRIPNAIVKTLEIKDFPTFQDTNLMARREQILSTIGTHLSHLPHKINVECLKISAKDQHDLVHFLPYIKPVVLKTIHVSNCDKGISKDFPLDTVARMEQWKKARSLSLISLNLMLPEKDIEHFDSITSDLKNISLEQTKASIEAILNGATKRNFYAERFDRNAILSYLTQFEYRSTFAYDEFKIRRDSASCKVTVPRFTQIMVFFSNDV